MECKNCENNETAEKFCYNCGNTLHHERITVHHLLHEVLHTYTHLEKGFLYVIKKLAMHPGTMQKEYLEGYGQKYQKPFPMFVICATLCAIVLYFTNKPYTNEVEQYFYKNYYVIMQGLMLPVYAFSTWILFRNSKLYYAEVLVQTVYMIGFMVLIIIPINIFHFAFNNLVISYIEIVLLAGYNVWTNLNFFKGKRKAVVIVKSLVNVFICYMLFQFAAELFMDLLIKH
jgi:hypothetical protein